jgi:hypothetical protein
MTRRRRDDETITTRRRNDRQDDDDISVLVCCLQLLPATRPLPGCRSCTLPACRANSSAKNSRTRPPSPTCVPQSRPADPAPASLALSEETSIRAFLDIRWKSCLVCDLLHCEVLRAVKKSLMVVSFAYALLLRRVPNRVQLFLFALSLSFTQMSYPPKSGPSSERQKIASGFISAFSANFCGGTLCGFPRVKRKLCRFSSLLKCPNYRSLLSPNFS